MKTPHGFNGDTCRTGELIYSSNEIVFFYYYLGLPYDELPAEPLDDDDELPPFETIVQKTWKKRNNLITMELEQKLLVNFHGFKA